MPQAAARLPTLFIPHGGGPCFFMEWTRGPADTWARLETWLKGLIAALPARPRAILIVSGHWEEPQFTVGSGARPGLIFDYYGFPAHTYELTFPAPGSPELAGRIQELLQRAELPASRDPARGWDHGVFVPLKLITPEADIPVVQLSLKADLDVADHLAAGRALAPLRDEGVLIVGSGMSWHNMRFSPDQASPSKAFDAWLERAASEPGGREAALAGWAEAPYGRLAHPREEHLVPLFVAAGAADGEPGTVVFRDNVMNVDVSAIAFGDPGRLAQIVPPRSLQHA